jgi:hypothetical protein
MIIILVEGDCEKNVLPIIAKREAKPPIKCIDMKGKSNIIRVKDGFEETVRRQNALGASQFVVLVDGDVTFAPYRSLEEEREDMKRRSRTLSKDLKVKISICWAVLQTESWIVGGMVDGSTYCGLKSPIKAPSNTENSPPNPKQWIRSRLSVDYGPQSQRCLAQKIDIKQGIARNSSLKLFLDLI